MKIFMPSARVSEVIGNKEHIFAPSTLFPCGMLLVAMLPTTHKLVACAHGMIDVAYMMMPASDDECCQTG